MSQVLQSKTIKNGDELEAEITYYYYGQGLLSQENSKGYLTYHFNNVGSTMAVTDAEGMKVASYNYSPYGELLEGEYDENIQFLYNGQYGVTTDGNGLYYMRARYYNVDIKRFINQDVLTGTLERISSLNRYSYVEGNPVSYLDPFGLEMTLWDALHEGIEKAMLYMTIAMVVVAGVSAIGAATGNLALSAYSSYIFVNLSNANSLLGKINIFISGMDLITSSPNEDAENLYDFLLSLTAIISPFIDEASNIFKFKKLIVEVSNLIFGDLGKQVLKIVSE